MANSEKSAKSNYSARHCERSGAVPSAQSLRRKTRIASSQKALLAMTLPE